MGQYTPFKKSLEELKTADLQVLREVNEGWYIEYKQQMTDGKSISKSLSALANTYGGWLFYGVKEESKNNSVAGTFLGIPIDSKDTAVQAIRSAAAKHMNPTCHFDIKIFEGPCEVLGLGEDKAIICVIVPQSIEAPHIHDSGRIYRRVADSSDPVPETDRYMVDKLFQRSQKKIEHYKTWHDQDPELSKGESEASFIRIMIEPNIWDAPRPSYLLTLENFRDTLNPKTPRRCEIPFDTVYSRAGGYVARQCINNDPSRMTFTWDIGYNLSGDVLIPLSSIKGNISEIRDFFGHYEHTEKFLNTIEKHNYESANVIDLNHVLHVLMSVIETQQALQKLAGWPTTFSIKVKVLNIWRTIPFVDVEYIIDYMRKYGIPLSLAKNVTTPSGTSPYTFLEIEHLDEESNETTLIKQSVLALTPIANSLGLPFYQMALDEDLVSRENKSVYHYFAEAGNRASKRPIQR